MPGIQGSDEKFHTVAPRCGIALTLSPENMQRVSTPTLVDRYVDPARDALLEVELQSMSSIVESCVRQIKDGDRA